MIDCPRWIDAALLPLVCGDRGSEQQLSLTELRLQPAWRGQDYREEGLPWTHSLQSSPLTQFSSRRAAYGPVESGPTVPTAQGRASYTLASRTLHIKMSDPNNLKRASSTSPTEDETPSTKSKKQHQSSPAPTEGGTFDELLQVSRSEAKGTRDA